MGTKPTIEQIRAAARLVPEHVFESSHGATVECADETGEIYRPWQPRADTEAGRSDALVLLAEVFKLSAAGSPHAANMPDDAADAFITALMSGDVQQIQDATFAAAVAIGEYMGVE